jgi:hypothetical protein
MMQNLLSLAAGAALLALSSTAYADQPLVAAAKQRLALSDKQMDGVTAGTAAISNGAGLAIGEIIGDTYTKTSVSLFTTAPPGASGITGQIIWAGAYTQSIASGGILYKTFSVAHADSLAQW